VDGLHSPLSVFKAAFVLLEHSSWPEAQVSSCQSPSHFFILIEAMEFLFCSLQFLYVVSPAGELPPFGSCLQPALYTYSVLLF
jgi:hypothetical protein